MSEPLSNGPANGRNADGTFRRGNPGGPGNPFAAQAGKRRSRLNAAFREDDEEKSLATLREIRDDASAKPADRITAANAILDRSVGKPLPGDVQQQLDELKEQIDRILERE
jgi:hypothetical protein